MIFRFKEEQIVCNPDLKEVNRFMQYCVYRLIYAYSTYFCGMRLIRHIVSATENGNTDVKKSISPVIVGNISDSLVSIISDDVFAYCEKKGISNFRIINGSTKVLDNKEDWKEIVVLKEFKYQIKENHANKAMLSFIISQEDDVKICTIVVRL